MLSPSQIIDFKENAVWQEIVERIEVQKVPAHDKALDESDPFEAGRYRALEMVVGLPDLLLSEIEEKPVGSSLINPFSRFRQKRNQ